MMAQSAEPTTKQLKINSLKTEAIKMLHDEAVSRIATHVRQFHARQAPFRIYHGSTNSTRPSHHRRDNIINTSMLNNVLYVDPKKKVVLVEPNVPMDALVAATLPHGLVPPVMMEFPGITAGGGFSGTSGESSSFRHGFFDRTVNWVEIVLPNGETVTASSTENPELFRGAAAAFGTLGVITLLEIRLVEAKKHVALTYTTASSANQAMRLIEDATADETVEYLDAIVFKKDWIVVCSGCLTNLEFSSDKVQRFTRPSDPWFYRHVEKLTASHPPAFTELIPLTDYLFRYDRGGFWVGRYAFKYFITPFDRITRFLLDRFMHTRVMYHALHQSGHSKQDIIQDVAVPYAAVSEFIDWLHDNFNTYPLWLCPLKQTGNQTKSPHGLLASASTSGNPPDSLMNFGIWGPGPLDRREFVRVNRLLEHKVRELGGKKWLYAHAYYTEEEFWSIYNGKEYTALRAKYHATYLPSLYDKVKVDVKAEEKAIKESWWLWLLALLWSIWPLSGLYGVYKACIGGDYLLGKQKGSQPQDLKRE